VKSRRPYLLRAIHEWICDSDCTPHIVVDAGMTGVDVPRQYVRDGKIILNVSWNATAQLKIGNDELSFSGRFGGASMIVRVPVDAVLAIYARETGQGMIFADEEAGSAPQASAAATQEGMAPESAPTEPPPKPAGPRPKLKVVK
jgi:stringent starvation protein B